MKIGRWPTLCTAVLLTFNFAVLAQGVITVPDDFATMTSEADRRGEVG
jgi:heme/copper-type cytochrome/quinol oxidase subunit 1